MHARPHAQLQLRWDRPSRNRSRGPMAEAEAEIMAEIVAEAVAETEGEGEGGRCGR